MLYAFLVLFMRRLFLFLFIQNTFNIAIVNLIELYIYYFSNHFIFFVHSITINGRTHRISLFIFNIVIFILKFDEKNE